ncbi:MAG TPA: DUF748 domain-containing protein [Candidatus Omnitrophota bacterium]|nr:DUF748 domain-containing protein [Candidatus Omnitrophota bacterium]HPT39539.1 DUF748 domain-containing protein [Candidatus Omnitrophota bacterium]
MEDWKKIFKIIAIAVIVFSLIYTVFLLAAKIIIAAKIEKATGLKTTISKIDIRPPFNIEVRGFEIANLVKADRIRIAPSIRSLLFGKLAFNKIVIGSPEIIYQRDPVLIEPVSDPRAPVVENQNAPSAPAASPGKVFPVEIRKLKIYSGRLNFIDNSAASGKINILIKDINFYITNLSTYGTKDVSNFELKGNVSWNTSEPDGKILLQGWVDFYKKDISAVLKVEDIDAIVFYPFYSNWVNLEDALIDGANLSFNCNLQGKNNDVAVTFHLELVDMVRKVRPPGVPQKKAERITDAVLDAFKSMDQEGRVALDSTFHTKMDQPEFSFANIKSAFEGKLMQARASAGLRPRDMLSWPGRWVRSGFKSGTDLSNAFMDGMFDLGNGIKKFFEDRMNKPVPAQAS